MNILRRLFPSAVIVVLAFAVTMSVAGKEATAGGPKRCPCDFKSALSQFQNAAQRAGSGDRVRIL